MSDFEVVPVGTAARLKELEAEVERLRAHQATAIAWLVMDESGDVWHATRWRDAAHDNIKDAINNGLYCAVRWVVRPVVYAAMEGQR